MRYLWSHFLILVCLLSGCAHQDEWTKQDTMLQLGVTGMIIVDAITTARIQDCEYCYEDSPFARAVLGSRPNSSDTYQFYISIAITSYLISRSLPAKWRPYWQAGEIGVHSYAVGRNCRNGLCDVR